MTEPNTGTPTIEPTRKMLTEFIRDAHITMTAERTDENPHMTDSHDMDHWKVRFRAGRSSMTTYFSMGYGHNGKTPTAADVLSCLASDATVEDYDFEEWCRDLGMDIDSRRAERIYNVTKRQTEKLRKFLGDSAFRTLVYHTELE